MVEGMTIDARGVGTALLFPSIIINMKPPIAVSPFTNVIRLRDEQARNALLPDHNYIGWSTIDIYFNKMRK